MLDEKKTQQIPHVIPDQSTTQQMGRMSPNPRMPETNLEDITFQDSHTWFKFQTDTTS
jgi:hypothetical protein